MLCKAPSDGSKDGPWQWSELIMRTVLIGSTMWSDSNYWIPDFGSMENKFRGKQGLSRIAQAVGESVGAPEAGKLF